MRLAKSRHDQRFWEKPTMQLWSVMAGAYGLDPPRIRWDGRMHVFPGAHQLVGTDAWYIAYRDQRGAQFGDRTTGASELWKMTWAEPPTELDRRKAAAFRDEHWSQDKEKRENARKQVRATWRNGKKPSPKSLFEYQFSSDSEQDTGLRIWTRTETSAGRTTQLLIPMYRRGSLLNLQSIHANRRREFWPEARVIGTLHVIGPHARRRGTEGILVYICEEWETGYTIHKATGSPVVVAFIPGNLKPVARMLWRRRRQDRFIIAADNDRWSRIVRRPHARNIPNPGVHYAYEAAQAVDGEVAIPDFKDLGGKPTNFNDLRLREGMAAVREWLDPRKHHGLAWGNRT